MSTSAARTGRETCRTAILLLAMIVLAAPVTALPGRAVARPHHPLRHPWTDGVVRCVAASAPPSRRHHPVVARRGGALPTDRAVFFARSGDRCVWHRGTTGRG
ncbi:MAG: hypothetical protein INR65_06425 [Gluconacetobacter diazotrophicus]|nr:hypothetical protein [Gluconacetobacter diazotrophicus]